jgi:hypothetical protein
MSRGGTSGDIGDVPPSNQSSSRCFWSACGIKQGVSSRTPIQAQTAMLTGDVAIQINVPRNTT